MGLLSRSIRNACQKLGCTTGQGLFVKFIVVGPIGNQNDGFAVGCPIRNRVVRFYEFAFAASDRAATLHGAEYVIDAGTVPTA